MEGGNAILSGNAPWPGNIREHGRARRGGDPRLYPQPREGRSEARAIEPLAFRKPPRVAPTQGAASATPPAASSGSRPKAPGFAGGYIYRGSQSVAEGARTGLREIPCWAKSAAYSADLIPCSDRLGNFAAKDGNPCAFVDALGARPARNPEFPILFPVSRQFALCDRQVHSERRLCQDQAAAA